MGSLRSPENRGKFSLSPAATIAALPKSIKLNRTSVMGTMPKLTQRFELGSNWTALKLPVVGTRLRCVAGLGFSPDLTYDFRTCHHV